MDFYGLAAASDRVCGPDTSPKRLQRPGGVSLQPGCQCADPPGLQRGDPQVQRPATAARKPPTDAAPGCAPGFYCAATVYNSILLCMVLLSACAAVLS